MHVFPCKDIHTAYFSFIFHGMSFLFKSVSIILFCWSQLTNKWSSLIFGVLTFDNTCIILYTFLSKQFKQERPIDFGQSVGVFKNIFVCKTKLFIILNLKRKKQLEAPWLVGRVLFENRPALYFCNYKFITAHKMYNF